MILLTIRKHGLIILLSFFLVVNFGINLYQHFSLPSNNPPPVIFNKSSFQKTIPIPQATVSHFEFK